MLNGEIWLCHSRLFESHWKVSKLEWVRSLGWFDRLVAAAKDNPGWFMLGVDPEDFDRPELPTYLPIVADHLGWTKLYRWNRKKEEWEHIAAPVVLENNGHVVGYAGPADRIANCFTLNTDPWKWEGITPIKVDPEIAVLLRDYAPTHTIIPQELKDLVQGYAIYGRDSIDTHAISRSEWDPSCKVLKLPDGGWIVDTRSVSIASMILPIGFDLAQLREALTTTDAAYAWVSDSRAWPGWFPANDTELDMIHVFPDQWNQPGAELFLPVARTLVFTEGATMLNTYPGLKFYDRPV